MSTKNLSEFTIDSSINTETMRFGIVVSEWNAHITDNLLKGAKDTLTELGVKPDNIKIYYVPGSFELSFATQNLCKSDLFNGVIAIGSVIRGETAHFDYVCQAVAYGITEANLTTSTPAVFCVLTDDTEEQAINRSGGKFGNKGIEAAVTAIKMAHFKENI